MLLEGELGCVEVEVRRDDRRGGGGVGERAGHVSCVCCMRG